MRDPAANDNGKKQKDYPDDGHLAHFAWSEIPKVKAHKKSYGNSKADGECAPGILLKCIDNCEPEARKCHDDDEQNRQRGGKASHRSYLVLCDLRQGLAVPPHRHREKDEVMHCAGHCRAYKNP